jgi:hypothetical protein
VGEDRGSVALEVLGVVHPHGRRCQERGEPRLALIEGPCPPVRAVQLEQVDGIERHLAVMGVAVELVETSSAVAPYDLPDRRGIRL